MKKSNVISLILSAVLILSLFAFALPSSAKWDGTSVAASLSGTGDEATPFIIRTEAELAKLAQTVNEGTSYAGQFIRLEADLDLDGKEWTPIGSTSANCFSGTFDGGEHTVSGLTVNTTGDYAGLFGVVKDGTVKNLSVEAESVYGIKYAGVIAGHMMVTAGSGKTVISNCHVTSAGSVVGSTIGGIVGRASTTGATVEQMIISGCSVKNAKISSHEETDAAVPDGNAKNAFIGGIIGAAGAITVQNTFSDGIEITGGGAKATAYATLGGIVGVQGASSAPCNIHNCYCVNSKITVLAGTPAGEKTYSGGIVGRAGHGVDESEIKNCFAIANVLENNTAEDNVGSICGGVINWINVANLSSDSEKAIGYDQGSQDYPSQTFTSNDFAAADAVEKLGLNNGNSKTVWLSSPVDGHPVIDIDASADNVCSAEAWDPYTNITLPETSAADTSESAPDESAPAESEQNTAPETDPEPTQPAQTAATTTPVTEPAKTKKGCGSAVSLIAPALILGFAVITAKKRK